MISFPAHLCSSALTACGVLMGTAHSATLVVGQSLNIESQNHSSKSKASSPAYHVSLNEANPGLSAITYQTKDNVDGPAFTVPFKKAIQGYHFVHAKPKNKIGTVISNGVSISITTSDAEFSYINPGSAKIWVSSNPGPDLEKPATNPDCSAGIGGISSVNGSIDISGLSSGTVYFFYGDYRGRPSIIAAMLDHDGPELGIILDNFHNGDLANNSEHYVASINFVNDAGYDTIEYSFVGVTGRWDGIVVTGNAIP